MVLYYYLYMFSTFSSSRRASRIAAELQLLHAYVLPSSYHGGQFTGPAVTDLPSQPHQGLQRCQLPGLEAGVPSRLPRQSGLLGLRFARCSPRSSGSWAAQHRPVNGEIPGVLPHKPGYEETCTLLMKMPMYVSEGAGLLSLLTWLLASRQPQPAQDASRQGKMYCVSSPGKPLPYDRARASRSLFSFSFSPLALVMLSFFLSFFRYFLA